MRLIDAREAKEQIKQMTTLKPSERALLQLAIDRTPTYEPPNPPLTPEEIREMDGEAVYLKDGHCYIVYKNFQIPSKHFEPSGVDREGHQMPLDVLATFGVYRRKPEKETI